MEKNTHFQGEFTNELLKLFEEYFEKYRLDPDGYDELDCSDMTYDEFMRYIRYCLEHDCEMVDIL